VATKRREILLRCLAISVILLSGPVVSAQQICPPGTPSGPVQAPVFVTNLAGQTNWFASPVVYDLDGNGAPTAPAVGDLDGDRQLEVFVQTFDHGLDVFTFPGSATNCLMWTTARGGRSDRARPIFAGRG
jgi:hypothetical protein